MEEHQHQTECCHPEDEPKPGRWRPASRRAMPPRGGVADHRGSTRKSTLLPTRSSACGSPIAGVPLSTTTSCRCPTNSTRYIPATEKSYAVVRSTSAETDD